jgi:hypothetical protein
MPFTPAHPAIVLPFLNWRKLSATALVIGSMSPDFEYFFKLSVNSTHSHTVGGIFYFDLPVVIVLSVVFHLLVKQNLFANLPVFFQLRFHDARSFDLIPYLRKHPTQFLVSAILGAASHLFWDSFTHNSGYFARNLWFYKGTAIPFDGVNYPLFYALQHISTIVGLISIACYIYFREPQQHTVITRPSIAYWLLLLLITAAIVLIRFAIYPDDYNLGNVVVSSISGLCLALIINGMFRFRSITTA